MLKTIRFFSCCTVVSSEPSRWRTCLRAQPLSPRSQPINCVGPTVLLDCLAGEKMEWFSVYVNLLTQMTIKPILYMDCFTVDKYLVSLTWPLTRTALTRPILKVLSRQSVIHCVEKDVRTLYIHLEVRKYKIIKKSLYPNSPNTHTHTHPKSSLVNKLPPPKKLWNWFLWRLQTNWINTPSFMNNSVKDFESMGYIF